MNPRLFPRPSVLSIGALALFAAAPLASAQSTLYVTSRNTDEVLAYDASSGAPLGVFASGGGLDNPVGLTFGPDGALYVASDVTDSVLRYDALGAFVDVFAQGGGLDGPRQVNFGPDGHLYVASGATNQVLRYDGTSGTFLGVAASGGSLSGPTSFCFAPSGELVVGSVINDRVKRYTPASGAFLGNLVLSNVNGPHDVAFGPDGALYVSNAFLARIQRFDATTGAFLGTFVSDAQLANALGLCWDDAGNLLVANQGSDEVLRYDGVTGAFLGALVAAGAGGLDGPLFVALGPSAGFAVRAPAPDVAGVANLFVVEGAAPGASLRLGIDRGPGLRTARACAATWVLAATRTGPTLVADEGGRVLLRRLVPLADAGRIFALQALEPRTCAATPVLRVLF